MSDDDLLIVMLVGGVLLALIIFYFVWSDKTGEIRKKRVAKVISRRIPAAQKAVEAIYLRRKSKENTLPVIGEILNGIPLRDALSSRLRSAGMTISADAFLGICAAIFLLIITAALVFSKPLIPGIGIAFFFSVMIPYFIINIRIGKRNKKFLLLFPEAIDFMVRGLKSGLPVTESISAISNEMEEPLRGVFRDISESIRLGVPVEKALFNTAAKLKLTEFNFFVTSLILQRETGGNLSEILSNLSDALRNRQMMRMKIKAMSSEAKASAIILGSLPVFVIFALWYISPHYLDPFFDDPRGHMAAFAAIGSLCTGIGIMFKMSRFEI